MAAVEPTTTERRTLHWRRLLRAAAVADLAVMGAAGLWLRDPSAVGIAGLFLLGIGFLRIRRGIAGIVMLGVLALDTAVFMLPAAASNLAHRDDLFDILIPASLATISLAGVVAAIGGTLWPHGGGRAAPIVAQHALAVVGLAVIGGLLAQRGDADQAARPGDLAVAIGGTSFTPSTLTAPAGEVRVAARNDDLFWHTFTLVEIDADLGVPIGAQRRLVFTAPAGTYTFVCRVPGHAAAGMRGTLRLT